MKHYTTLEDRVNALENRVNYQDHLHRHVGPDGNVRHFYNLLPTMIVSTIIGAVAAAIMFRYFSMKEIKS